MKRIIIIPVEGDIQVVIETNISVEGLEESDVLLCNKTELIKELKRILVAFGISE